MSRNLHIHCMCACGLIVAAIGAGPVSAAPSEVAQRDPSQTTFIDLKAGAEARVPPEATPNVSGASSTMFIDLSTGATPTPMQNRNLPPGKTPRTRHIDLSNGAAPPSIEASDEEIVQDSDIITITASQLGDPYEEANRARFRTHVALHRYAIDPAERAYIYVVPEPARMGMHNFLTNLETPSALANDVFQGKMDRAGDTLSRFVVNSTLGIGGVFDIAGMAGIPYRDDDFGATLATYGVSESPYLLVPVIGPSNPRDLSGKVVDFLLNPLRWVTLPGGFATTIGHAGLRELDKRSVDAGELDLLARTAPDAYATERTRARERRSSELNGTPVPRQ
jgi:phospholipid-binding lipoprotein MlaA